MASAAPRRGGAIPPGLCLAQAMTELNIDHLESVERLLAHAERAFPQHREEPWALQIPTSGGMVAEVPAAIALLRAELAYDRADADGVAAFAKAALAQMAEDEHGPRMFARSLVLGADWMTGRVTGLEPAFAALLAGCSPTELRTPLYRLAAIIRRRVYRDHGT
jgi:ATP/maltotriose-dependent transcriptional regulator MalT